MDELFNSANSLWLAIAAIVVLALAWFVYRRRYSGNRLKKVLSEISHDRIDGLVLPNGDDGEIQIDHLVLTSQGLLIVDIKDAIGIVFGSDKMQEWTVISEERRYTFPNPQEALYDRIAAVRHIVRQVPVVGRNLFLEGAEFHPCADRQLTPHCDVRHIQEVINTVKIERTTNCTGYPLRVIRHRIHQGCIETTDRIRGS